MLPITSKRIFGIAGLAAFLLLSVLFSQTPTPTTQPSPDATPTASPSPSPSPARAPSPTPLPGAQNFHQWGSVTVFNGLPSDSVRAIAQTHDGVMWFGTDNGLARFDGRRIQKLLPGGPDTNGVLALAVSPTGELWIGTRSGAFVYSENRFQPVAGTLDYGITKILLAQQTVLGTDAGLVLVAARDQSGSFSATALYAEPIKATDGSIVGITGLIQRDGKLIASTSGRAVVDIIDGRVAESDIRSRTSFVHAMSAGEDGSVWLGTEAAKGASGVYSANAGAPAVRIQAPTADVLSLEANESGVWAGTERYGLFHFAKGKLITTYTFENTSGGLRSNTVFTLFTDREGVLWIGTNRGVSRFDRLGAFQETVSDVPNSNFIRTLCRGDEITGASGDRLYAGSNRGLFYLNDSDRWTEVPGLRNKVVYALKFRGGGSIFAATSDGLIDTSGNKLLNGDVRNFATFNSADYAAVFGRGVVEMTSGTPRQLIFDNKTATSLWASFGKLWIGTAGEGLFSFDGRSVKRELGPDVLKSGTIWKMTHDIDSDGALYIAGQHGVFRYRDGKVDQIIAVEDVRDVLPIGGHIWAATATRGLIHARQDERFGWLVSSVSFEQGLPSEKAFALLPVDDGLLIATNRGVVTYRPAVIAPKLIATRVLSQKVHDLAELSSAIPLDYPQNSLLVEVAGQSSRTFPEEFQYAFVLTNAKGSEIDRRISNESQYSPTDLSPGEYTIEAIAFNRDLLPSEPLVIHFSVAKAPFPWTATALGVLLLMALVALAWAIFEHRRIRQRNRELAAARLDLANEAERERRRIARDLHDQTLADLRNLMIKSDKFGYDKGEFRNEIEAVSTDIRRICEDLSPSVLENVGLVAALEFLLTGSIQNHRFSTSENADELVNFPMTVQLHIYRIAQEILANIVQHSTADLVEMNVDVSVEKGFLLSIRDNGQLFQPGKKGAGSGRGVSNIKSRANLIKAKIDWTIHPDGGNLFSLRLGD